MELIPCPTLPGGQLLALAKNRGLAAIKGIIDGVGYQRTVYDAYDSTDDQNWFLLVDEGWFQIVTMTGRSAAFDYYYFNGYELTEATKEEVNTAFGYVG